VGSLLIGLLLAVAGVLFLMTTLSLEIDVTPFKDHITPLVEKYTGLEVQVDGEVRFRSGPRLGIEVRGVRVVNPDQAPSPAIFSADHAALQVETAALLAGELRPTHVELEGSALLLERDRDGRANWQPYVSARPRSNASAPALGWLVTDSLTVLIRDSRLSYSDRQAQSDLEVELTRAEVVPEGQRLRIDLNGSINSQPLRVTGSTTTLAQLIAAEGAVPIDLSGAVLGLKVDAKGTAARPRDRRRHGRDAGRCGQVTGRSATLGGC